MLGRLSRSLRSLRLHKKQQRFVSSGFGSNLEESPSREDIRRHQNDIFLSYKTKMMSVMVPRIEKIEVQYTGRSITDDATLLVNKRLSTPFQCAMHISQRLAKDSVVALVRKLESSVNQDGTIVDVKTEGAKDDIEESPRSELVTLSEKSTWDPWDMNRPLEFDCELKFLSFNMNNSTSEEIKAVNRAYWNSCALVLGAVAEEAFKEDLDVKLVHLPNVTEECGAFCYDIQLSESLLNVDGSFKWMPDESTLISLTKSARHIISQNLRFERLEIEKEEAVSMFKYNEHLLRRIKEGIYTSVSKSLVPIYRFGKYIDICDGPLVPSTSVMYHFVVTAVHSLRQRGTPTCLWRFQGLSLPKQLQVHHAVWAMLEHRARNLAKKDLPFTIMNSTTHKFNQSLHNYKSIENRTKRYNIATGQWVQDGWESSHEKIGPPT